MGSNSHPSAAKWNILGTNDASFNDGTGIADGVVTSPKLAEAFAKVRYQKGRATPVNSQESGITIQTGWGYAQGDGASATLVKAVTFPVAYTTVLNVVMGSIARYTGADTPTEITDFNSATATSVVLDDITTTGFNASVSVGGTSGATTEYGFSWIAIGIV